MAKTAPTQRDQHVLAIESEGRFAWKRTSGYYAQAYAENAFARFKQTFGDRLRAKRDEAQEREASLACQLLNRMRELVALSLMRLAESGVRGPPASSHPFVQQTRPRMVSWPNTSDHDGIYCPHRSTAKRCGNDLRVGRK